MHSLHFSLSIFTWNGLNTPSNPTKAPRGQMALHHSFFLVRIGRTSQNTVKRPKMAEMDH